MISNEEEKYLSIITNFGCHYTCPYCIVKNNHIDVPVTTIEGLENLKYYIIKTGANIVSVSGGGDPLHNYDIHKDWYDKLFEILDELNIPLELHTSYLHSNFPIEKCKRVVYHLQNIRQLKYVSQIGDEIIRVVYVVTDDMTEEELNEISDIVEESSIIDELTFRQRVDKDYKVSFHLHEVLLEGHKRKWWYVQQADYNLYYVENRIYQRYSDLQTKEKVVSVDMVKDKRLKKSICIALLIVFIALLINLATKQTINDAVTRAKSEQQTTEQKSLDFIPSADNDNKIIIPAVTGLNMKSNSIKQTVNFYNPETNNCAFVISIYLSDDILIYKSELLYPSENLNEISLYGKLDKGLYKNVRVVYDCHSLTDRNTKFSSNNLVLEINSY